MSRKVLTAQRSGRASFVRRGRIVYAVLAVLVFIGLAPLATVAWKLIATNREALTTSQQEYQLFLTSSVTRDLDTHVEGLRSQMLQVAQTLSTATDARGTHSRIEEKAIRRVLADALDERVLYTRYSMFSPSDVISVSAGRIEGVPPELEPLFMEGLTGVAASAVSAQGETRLTILSAPLLLPGYDLPAVFMVSAPVISSGQFRGVLTALVSLQTIWEAVIGHHRTGHTIYVLDQKGLVLVSSDPVHLQPGRDLSNSALVRRFLSVEGRSSETMPYAEVADGAKEHFLGSYEVSRQNWGIFVRAKLNSVYLPVRTMVESTLNWALVALSLAALAALFSARYLSDPINKLAAASREFAKGKYTTRVQVRNRNEIGELAHTFNAMATKIQDDFLRLKRAAEENHALFMGTIKALAQAIDAKDPYTRGHSTRVSEYAVIIAEQLGLSPQETDEIRISSLLHDIGKIGIGEQVLNKPSKLSKDEYALMKQHPLLGADIMLPISQMEKIIPGLRWHHERMSGGGYPDGLTGERIPLQARIIAVADTFDAITTTRPYQEKLTFPDGLQILNNLKGKELDAKVVEAFNRAYHAGQIRAPELIDELQRQPQRELATT